MNWNAIGALAELLGALGVIASLLYLARQIALNNTAMRASAHQKAIDSALDVGHVLLRYDLVDSFRKGSEDWDAISPSERARLAIVFYVLFRSLESSFNQYKMGMLERDVWEGFMTFYTDYCTAPGIQRYWQLRRDTFSPDFQRLVDSMSSRSDAVRLERFAADVTDDSA